MNLADPQLELIDPTPNVHSLFLHFDKVFFWTKLASRAVVRWSKRMYSCAGTCSYEGYGGLCDIALSEPLLKLRPRKDLVETLLHEMIHAYLFITNRDRDRDGHGPNFQAHMHRINKSAGLRISIYHDFHDEVKLYLTHWWRCDGPCQSRKPYFGIVRKTTNRPPNPKDHWWELHKRSCGGTFIKIKEPEQQIKKAASKASKKPNADITKYVTTTRKTTTGDLNIPNNKGILKDSNNIPNRPVISSKKGIVYNPQPVFNGAGKTLNDNTDIRKRSNSVAVMETVRNVWANKQLPTTPNQISSSTSVTNTVRNIWANKQLPTAPNQINNTKPTLKAVVNKVINKKHKSENVHIDSPPSKVKKIDDYFKNAATVLKDLYGQDFNVSKSKDDKKLVAMPVKGQTNVVKQENAVDCPICHIKVISSEINRHLDECLNKEVISDLCDTNQSESNLNINIKTEESSVSSVKTKPGIYVTKGSADTVSKYNNNNNVIKIETTVKTEPILSLVDNDLNKVREKDKLNKRFYSIDLTNLDSVMNIKNNVKTEKPAKLEPKLPCSPTFDGNHINKAKEIANPSERNKRRSVDFTNINSLNNFDANKAIKAERSNNIFTTLIDNDINFAREKANTIKQEKQLRKSDSFSSGFKDKQDIINTNIKIEPGTSKGLVPEVAGQTCPCCDRNVNKPIEEHLDECLAFFDNNTTIPEEGASASTANQGIIVIDDDNDEFDESLTLNATGTKYPCPCCLEMVEQDEMNEHLNNCLS